jgi:hypothetical protein
MGSLTGTYGAAAAEPTRRDRPLVEAGLHRLLSLLVALGLLFWAAVALAVASVLG